MYDTWGGTSRILGARGLRKKLSPVEGFRPPTHYVVWVGEPDYIPPLSAAWQDQLELLRQPFNGSVEAALGLLLCFVCFCGAWKKL